MLRLAFLPCPCNVHLCRLAANPGATGKPKHMAGGVRPDADNRANWSHERVVKRGQMRSETVRTIRQMPMCVWPGKRGQMRTFRADALQGRCQGLQCNESFS